MSPRLHPALFAFCAFAAAALPSTLALRAQTLPSIAGPLQGKNSACVAITIPPVVRANDRLTAVALLQNNGSIGWQYGVVRLAAGSDAWGIDTANIQQQTVLPGGFASVLLPITAPAMPGAYSFAWQPIWNDEAFGAVCKQGIRVLVPLTQCSDGIDNDGDGVTDFPDEPGCTSPRDNDESDAQEALPITLTEQWTTNSLDVKPGQKNVRLLRVEVRAGAASGAALSAITFRVTTGSLLNAENYTLWTDTDNDGWGDEILSSNAAVETDGLAFSSFAGGGLYLGAGMTRAVEVHADISPAPPGDKLQISLETSPNALTAETMPGRKPLIHFQINNTCPYEQCAVDIRTAPTPLLRFVSRSAE